MEIRGDSFIVRLRENYLRLGQRAGAALYAPSRQTVQAVLFLFGTALLVVGLTTGAAAQGYGGEGLRVEYNDVRISDAVNAILTYLEGTFGALVMVAAGLGAILSAAFGQYRAALGCLIIAVGSFILRSVLSTFFNDQNVTA